MTRHSSPELLVLHGVRLLGFADTVEVAGRFALDPADTARTLAVAQERDWVQHTAFADLGGWSLTGDGRAENERQLARERAVADPDDVIGSTYREFLPLNARLLRACTEWQLAPSGGATLATNEHTDPDRDARILDELAALHRAMVPLVDRLTGVLARFTGYDSRFAAALRRAWHGEHDWVDRTHVDSCHRVWFQLHEDLMATLGIDRGAEH
ncbi:hypothetical protein SAMN05421678_103261 [Actinopolymorpha cephalotaxi]|uniref:Transcriptional regulator n=1 Tax=Actinopolymorpha cephalotaxi TaxID=504797 RepID=A0A1I2NEK4_9ACTN|nr:transcriptional regulator [Actinopolymorpha cephalotaxi]NYH85632.1 hypothetical protein [Actinopolymorpha cephalotaxi]SFG00117.1 hypothetical protein SAMN05421678_103261 [Actinopolymorpha cephalotaxi]